MSTERNDTSATSSDSQPVGSPARSYEPPAVAWEEPFEATMAVTCAFFPLDSSCDPSPSS